MNAASRWIIRRRDWGDENALARRARRYLRTPFPLSWLCTQRVRIEPVGGAGVHGEWIIPEPEPADGLAAGVILYLHGGGYVSCSAASHRPITSGLAHASGRPVFSADYRLAPEHRFPAALDDAIAAYRWLLGEKVDPRSMVVAGESAGGGLVLSLLQRARDEGLPLPGSAVCFSPWADLTGQSESSLRNDGRCALLRGENVRQFAAAYLGEASALDARASPLFGDFSGLPPVLLQVGSTEILLDDACRVHEKIQRAGGASQLEIFDRVCHGWQMLNPLVPEARLSLEQAAEFIDSARARR
jgi:acetyl esterase/lipase